MPPATAAESTRTMPELGRTDSHTGGKPPRWGRRLIPPALILVGVILVAVVALMRPATPTPPPAEPVPVNVEVRLVRPTPELPDTFDLTGVIEPDRVVNVAAEVAGRIERYGQRTREVTWHGQVLPAGRTLTEGEPVSAGDPLVHLNRDLLEAAYERSRAQAEYDEREYRRILDLFERGLTSKTELDDARTRRDISKATLDEAARQLARTTILAPCDGILNRLVMEVGEYARPGDVVAEIVVVDTVKVAVDVPERDVSYLKLGRPADVIPLDNGAGSPSNGASGSYAGQITYISARADEGTRTTRTEVTIPNPAYRLHAGQIVRVRLTRRVLHDVIMVPLASVIPLEDGKEVYVVVDGCAQRRPVELGLIKGREVQILSGLAPGDRLIVNGQRLVASGQPVRVVQEQ